MYDLLEKFTKKESSTRAKMHSDLKNWPIFSSLEPEFISRIYMVMVYGTPVTKALIVTKNRKVYSLCENCKDSLESHNCNNTLYPREVEVLCDKKVKTFACGRSSYFLALTEDGKVYSGNHNCCCKVKNIRNQSVVLTLVNMPSIAGSPRMKHVVDIACGGHHSLVLTEDGQIFCWDKNAYCQVGSNFNLSSIQISEQHQIRIHDKIVQIACGQDFSLVVTKSGEVYGWGEKNNFIQLGKSNLASWGERDTYNTKYVNKVDLPSKIVKVACGKNYALALTDDGKVYAWGENESGQLGINQYGQLGINQYNQLGISEHLNPNFGQNITKKKSYISHMVCFGGDPEIIDIATLHSSNISVAVSKSKRIYVWGISLLCNLVKPTFTRFSTVHDVLACHAIPAVMHKPLILDKGGDSSILERLKNAFNDESTSDLTIQVEDQPIYVHKAILKICCPYFKNMFQHNWSENNQSVIKYSEYSYTVFKAFLKYLYTGMIDLPAEDAFELLKLADLYCEDDLKRRCIKLIKKNISKANATVLYKAAIEYNVEELEKFCFNFMTRHMTEVVLSSACSNLNESMLKTFICQAAKAGVFKT